MDNKNLGEAAKRQKAAQNIDESERHTTGLGQHDSTVGGDVPAQNEGEYWKRFGKVVH